VLLPPSDPDDAGALIRIRLHKSDAAALNKPGAVIDAEGLFDKTATHILQQIGYPVRHALVHFMFPRGLKIGMNPLMDSMDIHIPAQKDRVAAALDLFFEEAHKIHQERKLRADIPIEDAAPVLLFDEVGRVECHSRLEFFA
jgi:hypothetical protein